MNIGILDGITPDPEDRGRFNKSGVRSSAVSGGWISLCPPTTSTISSVNAGTIVYTPFILDFDVLASDGLTLAFSVNTVTGGTFKMAVANSGKWNRPDRWLTTFNDRTVVTTSQYTPFGFIIDTDLRAGEMYWGAVWGNTSTSDMMGVSWPSAGGTVNGVPANYLYSRFQESVTFGSWPAKPFAGVAGPTASENSVTLQLFLKLP